MYLHVVIVLLVARCQGTTNYISHVQNYVNLVSAYYVEGYSTVDFPPLADVSQVMDVQVGIHLYAINGFDEVAGNIELVAALEMEWTDEMSQIQSITFDVRDRKGFLVPYDLIWTPKLILINAIGDESEIGDAAYVCRYDMQTNRVKWKPRVVISASCTPDVTYYPFDKQKCEFVYSPWGYNADEILLTAAYDEWEQSSYGESGEWDIDSTSTETYIESGSSHIKFTMSMTRKPLYFAFNIVLPVLVLCLLNSTVFLLPVESGERVDFSVTCFLSFMVLLNMIMDIMPRSSSPISFLCFYLVIMMSNSGGMTLVTILLMRIYHKPEKSTVPKWLQRTVTFLNCGCAKLKCCVLLCRSLKRTCSRKNKGKRNSFSSDGNFIEITVDKDGNITERKKTIKSNNSPNNTTDKTSKCCPCCTVSCVRHDKESNKKCCFGCVIGFKKCKGKDTPDHDVSKDKDTSMTELTPKSDSTTKSKGCFCRRRTRKDKAHGLITGNEDAGKNMKTDDDSQQHEEQSNKWSCFKRKLSSNINDRSVSTCSQCKTSIGEKDTNNKLGTCANCLTKHTQKNKFDKESHGKCFSCFGRSRVATSNVIEPDLDNDVLPVSERSEASRTEKKVFTDKENLDTKEKLIQRWEDATSTKKGNSLKPIDQTNYLQKESGAKVSLKTKSLKGRREEKQSGKIIMENENCSESLSDTDEDISKQFTEVVRKIVRDKKVNLTEEKESERKKLKWSVVKENLPNMLEKDDMSVPLKSIDRKVSRGSKSNTSSKDTCTTDEDGDESDIDSLADLEEDVSWAEVGRIFDTFFFLAFSGGQAFFTVVFLVPLFTNDGGGNDTTS